MGDIEILSAHILWLRNHLDVGDPALRKRVLKRADMVLEEYPPSVAGMKSHREKFPDG